MLLKSITTGLLLASLALPAFAEGDVDKGKKVFKKCKACHSIGEGAKNKVGPLLTGIIDAPVAANAKFKYSKAMVAKGEAGDVWTTEELITFLTKPKTAVPKTKMSFPGLKKPADIENLLAYLASF